MRKLTGSGRRRDGDLECLPKGYSHRAVDAALVGGMAEKGSAPRAVIAIAKIVSGWLTMLRRRIADVCKLKERLRLEVRILRRTKHYVRSYARSPCS